MQGQKLLLEDSLGILSFVQWAINFNVTKNFLNFSVLSLEHMAVAECVISTEDIFQHLSELLY